MFQRDRMPRRLLMCFSGMIVTCFAVGLYKLAMFGVDPFQSLLAGLDFVLPLSFGTVSLLVNLLILVFTFFADRHYIGIGTVFNLLVSGYIIEFTTKFLVRLFPEPSVIVRIAALIIGTVVMCFAGAVYITADLGVSSYDSVALIIAVTWRKWKFKYVRIVCDLVCVSTGVALFFMSGGKLSGIGAVAGIGTIITAFFMGPLLDLFKRKAAEPMLHM